MAERYSEEDGARKFRKADKPPSWAQRTWNPFTPDLYDQYLEVIAECGLQTRAAAAVGCNPQEVYQHIQENAEFNAMFRQAMQWHADKFIRAAQERAVDGVQQPMIGGRNRDQVVAHQTVYSDRLLEMFLKRSPDGSFTDKQILQHTGQIDVQRELYTHIKALSKKARRILRSLLSQIEEDNARRALGEPLDEGVEELITTSPVKESEE